MFYAQSTSAVIINIRAIDWEEVRNILLFCHILKQLSDHNELEACIYVFLSDVTVNSDTKNTTQIQAHTHTTYFSQTYTKTRTQGRTLTPAKHHQWVTFK